MQLGLFSVLWQHKILGYPDTSAQIHMCVWERENMWAVLLLPVSIWCRLLLLRLRSLRSLDSTKCFGLRCFILLLDRSILTMSDGRSGGMLIKSADRKSSETLGLQLSWYLKDKSFYYHQCTQKKDMWTEGVNISGSSTQTEMCLHLYGFKMACRLCATFYIFKM